MEESGNRSELFLRGLEHQKKVWGNKYTRPSIYEEIDPDLYRIVLEFVHGEILSRPGLELKIRELLIVAVLTALGRPAETELHIHGALNVGCSRQEITETIIQTGVYAGFPAMHSAVGIAKKVFDERGI